ncbi:uncharacterized protein LOC133716896 [Rosa rugosa]|uniref:uncharacterized protein LOC133716896 n=1 Tax=Rosa rugosa TaxID=74645 RepID=UPI002B413459|nr:uncharacterized protein LOC133716896 [Rosa rugosa]
MDKKWVFLDRRSDEYISGLQAFINRSLEISPFVDKIKCPCKECKNRYYKTAMVVAEHMRDIGMWNRYVNMPWQSHGEQLPHSSTPDMAGPSGTHHPMPDHDMPDMLEDAFGIHSDNNMPESSTQPIDDHDSGPTPDARKFYELLKDADTDLFPGARIKKLDFIVRLYKIKCLHNNSDVSFSETLDLLKESFPEGETLPDSFYKTKKMIKDIGLSYEKIDACPNDCMLYWKEHKNDECCNVCGISRWKQNKLGNDAIVRGKKKPTKILRYFPLGPRLQRLYMSRHTAESMAWHSDKRPKDGQLRHPADSPAWAKLDDKYPNFGHEYRNVRLGLASDGFNPFGIMSSSHSTWPVVLSVYNLPPWLCMKQPYLILSLLIPGPKGPGNNIDVYLQPLVEELKMLWTEGLQTYDAFNKEVFTMRAAVLWTINDFPAYAMLSGYSTKGKKACPVCAEDTESIRLQNGKKESFMGHRRWLPNDHYYRGWRNNFNGFPERRTRPKPKTGSEILRSLHGLKVQFGKGNNKKNKPRKRKRATQDPPELDYGNWRKKSIFFELPYWEHLLLRHNLDVMHIEKNVTDSVVGTLLGIEGKNKDSVNARKDMVLLNVKHGLHPTEGSNGLKYPPASFNLLNGEKTTMCEVLSDVQPPDGWSSNIKNCVRVEERKLVGLKSHDCHILMQHLLPIAIRRPIRSKKLIKVLLELKIVYQSCVPKLVQQSILKIWTICLP